MFTQVPADLAPDRYAHTCLLLGGDAYLPGCLVVAAALRWHVHTGAALVCLIDDSVSQSAREMLGRLYDRVVVVPRLRGHDSSYPHELLSDAYRDMYTSHPRSGLLCTNSFLRRCDLLPIRCFDHLFTLPAPAAVIESVDPTSQFAYVQHMHGVRHGERVPPAILEVTSDDDVTGGINAGLLVIQPDRARFEDMTARIQRPMPEWGPHHRQLYDLGIRYGFPEQHFLQVEFQNEWTAIDHDSTRCVLMCRTAWRALTIGRKPAQPAQPGAAGAGARGHGVRR
jgi:hypothetical protein